MAADRSSGASRELGELAGWVERLPGRLVGAIGSVDNVLVDALLADMCGVTDADSATIWRDDVGEGVVRRQRWPADRGSAEADGSVRAVLVDARPVSSQQHLVELRRNRGQQAALILPLTDSATARDAWLVVTRSQACLWSDPERSLLEQAAGEMALYLSGAENPEDRALQDLVASVADLLTGTSAEQRDHVMTKLARELGQFFAVDVTFLRRNDHRRRASVLVAEWPPRDDVPDPDPLGVVPFDSDPMWAAGEHLREPYIVRPEAVKDDYRELLEEAAGVGNVTTAIVPLLREGRTEGVLGFVKFGDRPWSRDEVGALSIIATLIVQFDARLQAEANADYQSRHDSLTGLLTRRACLDELSGRLEDNSRVGVLALSLDRLDLLSESMGAAAADRVIVTVADRLRHTLRPGDVLARPSGSIFAIILSASSEMELAAVADRALGFVRQSLEVEGSELVTTASAGGVLHDPSSESELAGLDTAELLVHNAAMAAASARRMGGDRYRVYEAGDDHSAEHADRLREESLLRGALDNDGLAVHYQPEIGLADGAILGAEALVRWPHPTRGLLTAGAFIDHAEEAGLVTDLGWWVLEQACKQAADWLSRGVVGPQFEMRVNIAAAQLANREIIDRARDALALSGLPADLLCFEITERSMMADLDQAKEVLLGIRELGVRLAVDDFGVGFASMTYVRDLPVQVIKIDQTFVQGLGVRPEDEVIVESVVHLGQALGMDVVAEGVEEADQWTRLLALGCRRAQGFYLARPAAAEDIESVLSNGIAELVPRS